MTTEAKNETTSKPLTDEERQELMDRLAQDDQLRAQAKAELESSLGEEIKTLITSDAYKEVVKSIKAITNKATSDTRFNAHLRSAGIILGNLEDSVK